MIALGVLFCAGVAPGVLWLRLRTDGNALIPHDAPEIAIDQEIRDKFNLQDPVVVVIWSRSPEGIFKTHSLTLIADLTDAFQKLDIVDDEQVFSLATEYGDRVFPGTLNFRRLLDPVPSTQIELEQLRNDLRLYQLYTGMLLSYDGKGAAILVGARPGINRVTLLNRLQEVVTGHELQGEEVQVIGAPVAEALLGTHILQDLGVPHWLLGLGAPANSDPLFGLPSTAPSAPLEKKGEAASAAAYRVRTWIARHIGLVPVALLVMAAVFYFYFGSIPAVILPVSEVGACLVVVFALMGWLDVPIYLTIAVMPIILTAAGVTDEIHVFARYRDRLRERPGDDHREVLLATLQEIGNPVIMAGLTTGIGFLAFAFSPIAPVQAFGVFTAIGLAFCMAWSLTVIPACLALVDPKKISGRSRDFGAAGLRAQRFFGWLAGVVIRYRALVLLGAGVLAIATPLGISKVIIQDSWIDGFAPESDFYGATKQFHEQFHGGHMLLIAVHTGDERMAGEIGAANLDALWTRIPGITRANPEALIGWRLRLHRLTPPPVDPATGRTLAAQNIWTTWVTEAKQEGDMLVLKGVSSHGMAKLGLRLGDNEPVRYELTPSRLLHPEVMQRIADLESFIESHRAEAVGGVVGTAGYVETVHYLRRGRKEENRRIPSGDPQRGGTSATEEINWLWREYTRIRGEERVRQLVDSDFAQSVVTVFLRDANFIDTGRLMKEIRAYEKDHLAPHGIRLAFAGDVAVSQTLIRAIVGTQVMSVAASLLGDLVVTVILGRSLLFGLLCIIPSLLAVLLNFAVMGWTGMPLGVASSMFSSMTLGMGVDYAIHFLQNYRQHRAAQHNEASGAQRVVDALIAASRTTGPAIFGNTLAVTLGFGVLMLSQVPANARLGGLLVLSLFNCFAATMLILPALLGIKAARRGSNDPQTSVRAGSLPIVATTG